MGCRLMGSSRDGVDIGGVRLQHGSSVEDFYTALKAV